MPCDDCSTDDLCRCGPGEMCGACFGSRVQPEDVPKVLAAIAKPGPEASSDHLKCLCGHSQRHHRPFTEGGCHAFSCDCESFMLAPEPEPEPPLTPEEEEEAPEDEPRCTCGETACESERCDCDSAPCPVDHAAELPPPEGPEYTPCVCGHIEPEHDTARGKCVKCDCETFITRAEMEEEAACKTCGEPWHKRHECPPPQPERRPPYAVAYSVQGHLFEVALPGDASVRAVDGALVIQHHLGPVLGITQVLPVINEEQG